MAESAPKTETPSLHAPTIDNRIASFFNDLRTSRGETVLPLADQNGSTSTKGCAVSDAAIQMALEPFLAGVGKISNHVHSALYGDDALASADPGTTAHQTANQFQTSSAPNATATSTFQEPPSLDEVLSDFVRACIPREAHAAMPENSKKQEIFQAWQDAHQVFRLSFFDANLRAVQSATTDLVRTTLDVSKFAAENVKDDGGFLESIVSGMLGGTTLPRTLAALPEGAERSSLKTKLDETMSAFRNLEVADPASRAESGLQAIGQLISLFAASHNAAESNGLTPQASAASARESQSAQTEKGGEGSKNKGKK